MNALAASPSHNRVFSAGSDGQVYGSHTTLWSSIPFSAFELQFICLTSKLNTVLHWENEFAYFSVRRSS